MVAGEAVGAVAVGGAVAIGAGVRAAVGAAVGGAVGCTAESSLSHVPVSGWRRLQRHNVRFDP